MSLLTAVGPQRSPPNRRRNAVAGSRVGVGRAPARTGDLRLGWSGRRTMPHLHRIPTAPIR